MGKSLDQRYTLPKPDDPITVDTSFKNVAMAASDFEAMVVPLDNNGERCAFDDPIWDRLRRGLGLGSGGRAETCREQCEAEHHGRDGDSPGHRSASNWGKRRVAEGSRDRTCVLDTHSSHRRDSLQFRLPIGAS